MQPSLTILNLYEIQATPEAFLLAIAKLAERVRAEGHEGVLSYRFFSNPSQRQARAVIDYTGLSAWIGPHDISMTWPEMQALHHAARLVEVTFLGEMTSEIQNWINNSTLRAKLNTGFDFAAGFHR
jgi:hypothetical protein